MNSFKKFLIGLCLLPILCQSTAWAAPTCSDSLGVFFPAAQKVQLCKTFGSANPSSLLPSIDNTYDLGSPTFTWRTLYTGTSIVAKTSEILRVRQDVNRLFTFDAASDTAETLTWGDGTTAVQKFTISAATADGADDGTLRLTGGGAAATDGTRGGEIDLTGEEASGGGDITYNAAIGDTHIFQTAGVQTGLLDNNGLWTTAGGQTATTGNMTLTAGNLVFGAASAKIVPGATSLLIRNNADGVTNLGITDAGILTNSPTTGGLVLGIAAIPANVSSVTGGTPGILDVRNTSSNSDNMVNVAVGANTAGNTIRNLKTRASDGSAGTIVVSGDTALSINAYGADGTAYRNLGAIVMTVDGTPGASDMPGAIDFQVSQDGTATLSSVLKLTNDLRAHVANAIIGDGATLTIIGGTGATQFNNHASSVGLLKINDAGDVHVVQAKDINFDVGLGTIALQEAVGGTACSGSVTANGTTPVVTSTTCAITGSRIFLTKTANSTVNGSCFISAISTGVSFSITCLATDTGTYNFFIVHEAP